MCAISVSVLSGAQLSGDLGRRQVLLAVVMLGVQVVLRCWLQVEVELGEREDRVKKQRGAEV